jgi:ubiquinone/menaquinone biosynthesis C-methylase UbiE
MSQNVWKLNDAMLHRQRRRAELIRNSLRKNAVGMLLDIGCAEGYATSFISDISNLVVGVEVKIDYLRIAKSKVKRGLFINASIDHLPFRDDSFDAISILEVLEHLQNGVQRAGLKEVDRVLRSAGSLVISVPYNEQRIYTQCIHCGNLTPLYGHLHTFDENKISALLPSHFKLVEKNHLPNLAIVSCSKIMQPLPLILWYAINNLFGLMKKGYWIVLKYHKT